MKVIHVISTLALTLASGSAFAADYPSEKQGDWIAKDFKFHTGEVMPEVRLHYTTLGDPSGEHVISSYGRSGVERWAKRVASLPTARDGAMDTSRDGSPESMLVVMKPPASECRVGTG